MNGNSAHKRRLSLTAPMRQVQGFAGIFEEWLNQPVSKTGWSALLNVVKYAAVGVFALLVVGSYMGPAKTILSWTGFCGNSLWDWLGLFLVPVVLGVVVPMYAKDHAVNPEWLTPWAWSWGELLGAIGGLLAIVGLVALAYLSHWTLFGLWVSPDNKPIPFTGIGDCPSSKQPQPRALWDWLTLLILPLTVTFVTIRWHLSRHAHASGTVTSATGAGSDAAQPDAGPDPDAPNIPQ